MYPVMNRLTIGLEGELVVRVTVTRVSPAGIPVVSTCTVKLPSNPHFTTGMLPIEYEAASTSAFKSSEVRR